MFVRFSLLLIAVLFTTGSALANDVAAVFRADVLPVLKSRCVECHSGKTPEGEVSLEVDASVDGLMKNQHLWFRVLDQLEFQQMPPAEAEQLTAAERKKIVNWVQGDLTKSLAAEQKQTGRAKFRRLSRVEYANTFEDLFGYRPDVDLLPEDGRVDGYTKVSDALGMSKDGAFGYYQVSEELLDRWLFQRLPKADASRVSRAPARDSGQSPGHSLVLADGWIVSFNTDDSSGRLVYHGCKTPGWHKLRMNVYGYQTDQPLPFGVYRGKTYAYPQEIELAAILEAPPGKPAVVETEIYLKKGDNLRLIPFGLGVQVPKNHQASKCKGAGLAVQWLEAEEPAQPILADRWLTADFPDDLVEALRRPRVYLREKGGYSYNKISREEFLQLMRTSLARVGSRLFRRDLSPDELEGLLAQVAVGIDEERNLKDVISDAYLSLMVSPEFFCVVESPGELSDFALASRLAYFLWNSTPDEELLRVARAGKLREASELRRQTDRLLNDPKADRFVSDFVDQWLDLHAIDDTSPDKKLYPEYDDVLKFTSVAQTRAFFAKVLRENRSVRDFVAPSWLLVNHRLGEHYGLRNVKGVDLKVVNRPQNSPFGGLWTQPAILKVTADGSSTSPVKRGVWVSERLLGTPISPPPPNIDPINPDTRGATTLRQQLALHSGEGSCASCHKKFDPYGFALESFDVMGQFREKYRILDESQSNSTAAQGRGSQLWHEGLEVDSSGVTPEGQTFGDIVALRELMAKQPEKLATGVTRHLVTYATATPVSPLDERAIEKIVRSSADDDYGLRSLVHGVVQSELFRWK